MRLMHPKVFKKSDKLFACDQCDEKFDMSYKLKNHMATSTHGKAYLCTKCNQNFSTANPSDYIKHYQDTHGGLPPDFLDKETFVCDQCPRVFIAKGGLISESIFSIWTYPQIIVPNHYHLFHFRFKSSGLLI